MTTFADFGVHLRKNGFNGVWTFAPFGMMNICRVQEDTFSTMSNMPTEAGTFAVSLDFDTKTLEQIVALLPEPYQTNVKNALTGPFRGPNVVRFDRVFKVILDTQLGDPIRNDDEEYIPMIVTGVHPYPAGS